jgi:Asp-tRNA(Asn)/Glu-tRNA(Gln) amidotransferase A subunit family amidase
VFQNVDILITPTCFHDTVTYEEYLKNAEIYDEKDFFTACVNISGCPAITIPACISSTGLPVGIQLIADWNKEDLLLNVAEWFIKNNSSCYPYYDKLF